MIDMELVQSILAIIVIDLVLSGDNAVIIGMAAHRLPPRQRKMAIIFGGGAAIVLRIGLTAIATLLLQVPYLRFIGGIALLWIGFKLLKAEEESHEGVKAASSLREAIVTITIADFIMSTDNILGVAGASHGDPSLVLFGLILSIPILLFMGGLVADWVNRFWWIGYLGAGVIVWTGAEMALDDPGVKTLIHFDKPIELAIALATTIGTLAFAHWFHRVRGAPNTAS